MKELKLSGKQLGIIRDMLLRPNDGVTSHFFLKLQRVHEILRLSENLNETDEFDIKLEDADFNFLRSEWNAANTEKNGCGMWLRAKTTQGFNGINVDYKSLMNNIISVEEVFNGKKEK